MNLLVIMLEYMHMTMTYKDGKHGLGYGYLLTMVFKYFGISLVYGIRGIVKQSISMNTRIECECVEGITVNRCEVSELLDEHSQLKHKVESMRVTLDNKDVEIARLKVWLHLIESEVPGRARLDAQQDEDKALANKNSALQAYLFLQAFLILTCPLSFLLSSMGVITVLMLNKICKILGS